MSDKAKIIHAFAKVFAGVSIIDQPNGFKFHCEDLCILDIRHLSIFIDDYEEIRTMTVKRSGTGLTVIITL